jgi:protein gp37
MYREYKRYKLGDPRIVTRTKPQAFNKPLRLQKEAVSGDRVGTDRLVFTCSWSDFFNEEADEWRDEAWDIIRECDGLIFQILTKLPERIWYHRPKFWPEIKDRIWLGTTVENQDTLHRIEHLKKIPCAHRFLSLEPLIGPVKLYMPDRWSEVVMSYVDTRYRCISCGRRHTRKSYRCPNDRCPEWKPFDWVIVGGESGADNERVRPMHPQWVRDIKRFCISNGIPFYFKQWGEWLPSSHVRGSIPDTGYYSWPWKKDGDETMMVKVGRQKSGDKLDGKQYREFPDIPPYQEPVEQLGLFV